MRKTLMFIIVVALLVVLSGCETFSLGKSKTTVDPATANLSRNIDQKNKTTYRIYIGPSGSNIPDFFLKQRKVQEDDNKKKGGKK